MKLFFAVLALVATTFLLRVLAALLRELRSPSAPPLTSFLKRLWMSRPGAYNGKPRISIAGWQPTLHKREDRVTMAISVKFQERENADA